jgi:soluble lytic murein transglycosylase
MLSHIKEREFEKVIDLAKDQNLIENFDKISSKLRFWIAFALEQRKEYTSSKKLYLRQIQLSPLNFYSVLSYKQLVSFSPNYSPEIFLDSSKTFISKDYDLPPLPHFEFTKLRAILSSKRDYLLHEQVNNLISKGDKKSDEYIDLESTETDEIGKGKLLKIVIKELEKNHRHLYSFKFAYRGIKKDLLNFDQELASKLFPVKYQNTITSHASGIDPLIILSLIRQESAFNPRARSHANARGLMQLLPSTARQLKRRVSRRSLYNPKVNIKLGIKYLKKLLQKYDGNLVLALSAYNAGEGNVSRWLNGVFSGDNELVNIELIPFKETRNYVKYIYRNWFFYNLISESKDNLKLGFDSSIKIPIHRL